MLWKSVYTMMKWMERRVMRAKTSDEKWTILLLYLMSDRKEIRDIARVVMETTF